MVNDTQVIWLVDFYSPWCHHCQHFAPIWDEVSNLYKDVSSIVFGAVDCSKQNQICDNEGVHSYPGVKMYHVSPDVEAPIVMPPEELQLAKYIVVWIEQTLEVNGVQSLLETHAVYPEVTRPSELEKTFGDPVEPLDDDRSLDMKLKRLKDAGTTALFTFEDGFFMGTTVLEGERYEAAVTWVRALAATFPRKENRDALTVLVGEIKQRERWTQAEWSELIDKWKATANVMSSPAHLFRDKDDLALCTTATCGLWTLFHTITLSDAYSTSRPEQWKSSEVLSAVRLVVKHFFGCGECKRHFLKVNTDSLMQKLALRDEDGPDAVAFWMWTIHNIVNGITGKPMWPTQLSCPQCYAAGNMSLTLDPAQLNEEDIVAYVRDIYEFGDELTLEQRSHVATPWLPLRSIATAALLIAVFATVFQLCKHRLFKSHFKTRDHIA
uniref:Sulfhydryl oxidase n=1 Tax=Hyaloperonospora arabidopsidis (strain Emoy2) TaxID=559515 RepID=M4BH81_HYAAE